MVKTGILRTFGEALRSWLATRLSNRFAGFAAGMGLAMLLQSSTAASLLVASLQAGGLVSTAAALAAVLGADLGSALAARILTLNISSLIPILLIAGTFLFLRRMEKREGQFGRMLLGFAFVLLALQSIMASTEPMRDSPIILETLAHLPEHPFLAAAVGIACAVLFFSSLAVVAVTAAAALIDRLVPVSIQTDDFETHLLSKENLLSSSSALVQVRHENARTAELFRKHWDALTPLIYENPPMGELLAFKERRKLLDRRCRTVSKALNIIIRDDLSEEAVIEWQSLSAVSDALLFSLEVTNDIVDLLRKKKIRRSLFFSAQGAQELEQEHHVVSAHLELLAQILSTSDPQEINALRSSLLSGEAASSSDAAELVSRHMERVDKGSALSIETSALHLDLLLLFRRVDSILAHGARSFAVS
jgi:Na+/phosphate symporter